MLGATAPALARIAAGIHGFSKMYRTQLAPATGTEAIRALAAKRNLRRSIPAAIVIACRGGYERSFCIAPLHSVAMIDLSKVRNYYVACGYTDLRLGIDGLAAVVTQQYGSHFNEESLFLFCGRRTDRIKALYWCGEGYILLYKRLSNGRFQWPRSEAELRLLDPQSFRWLMEGLKVEQKTAIRKGKPKDLF